MPDLLDLLYTVGVAVGDSERFAVAARNDAELRAGERDSLLGFLRPVGKSLPVFHVKARFAWGGRTVAGGVRRAIRLATCEHGQRASRHNDRRRGGSELECVSSRDRVFHASPFRGAFPPNVGASKAWRAGFP